MQVPQHETWLQQINNPVTKERTKRRAYKAYEIDGDICYGCKEVYDRLHEMGYDLTFNQVNHLMNHRRASKMTLEKYPELDPDNPNGLVKLISKGQFYERWKDTRFTGAKFVLVYYFENPAHTRFYGASTRTVITIYKNFAHTLQFLPTDDQDIEHYEMFAEQIVRIDKKPSKAFDVLDRAIFDYLVDNPDYEAYNLDLVCHV